MCIDDIKKLIISPSAFFNESKKQTSLTPALKLYLIAVAVGSFFMGIVLVVFPNVLFQPSGLTAMPVIVVLGSLFGGIVGGIIGTFIVSGIVHIVALLLGGKNGYYRSFSPLAYASVPVSFVEWIAYLHPLAIILMIVFFLYFLYLAVVGLSAYHEVSKKRALAIILVPLLVLLLIIIAVIAFLAIAYVTGGPLEPLIGYN